jgi:hypothetical protein
LRCIISAIDLPLGKDKQKCMKAFAGGLILGALLASVAWGVWVSGASKARLQQVEAELSVERATVRTLREEAERARGKSANPIVAAPAAAPTTPSANGSPKKAGMGAMMKAGLRMHLEQRLNRMALRLKLSPEQIQKLRDLHEARLDEMVTLTEKIMAGEEVDPSKAKVDLLSDREALKEVLTDEQLAGLDAFQKEELQAQREMLANQRVSELAGVLALNEDQKDRVYTMLAAPPDLPKDLSGEEAQKMGARIAMGVLSDDQVRQLESVLAPAQMESYRKFREQQIRQVDEMLRQMPFKWPAAKPPGAGL